MHLIWLVFLHYQAMSCQKGSCSSSSLGWKSVDSSIGIYYLNKHLAAVKHVVVGKTPFIHDTTRCQTGRQTYLTTGWTTGCIVYTNIQKVVKPVWQPAASCKHCQPVVSCKRTLTIALYFSRTASTPARWAYTTALQLLNRKTLNFITARSELRKVLFLAPWVCGFTARSKLFLALSVTCFFVCMWIKYLGDRWTDLHQIHREDVFGPSLG